jgi:hypothetical protein
LQRKVLFETQYFPCTYLFAATAGHELVLEQHEHYQKRSLRNKCIIANSHGIQCLTIPLKKGKHEQQPINEVQISYQDKWQRNHLQSIQSAYGKSPYFDHYYQEIEDLYSQTTVFLFEFNLNIIHYFCSRLHLANPSLSLDFKPQDIWKDESSKITVANFQEFGPVPSYSQVFEDRLGFLANLSILDLLFCCGPAATTLLQVSRE